MVNFQNIVSFNTSRFLKSANATLIKLSCAKAFNYSFSYLVHFPQQFYLIFLDQELFIATHSFLLKSRCAFFKTFVSSLSFGRE